tara:strand:- start:226494 stop:227024 length:531 start_codon:yes stop_codon:yes gene_type:complete
MLTYISPYIQLTPLKNTFSFSLLGGHTMSQTSPLNAIVLPQTAAELKLCLNTTVEYYKTHVPEVIIALDIDVLGANNSIIAEYVLQFQNMYNLIEATAMPCASTYNFESICFDPNNLKDFKKASFILECSLIHALVNQTISQETYDSAGVMLLNTLLLPLMFGAETAVNIPLYSPE